MLLVCGLKLLEETDIVLGEHAQVLDLVFEVCDTLNTHTQSESSIFLAVYAVEFQYIGMYHTATQDLNPTGTLAEGATLAAANVAAYIHLSRWLCEGEVAGAQTYLGVGTKHLLCKVE